MRKSKKKELIIPKWQIGVLLFTSLAIFITTIAIESYLGELSLWFFIGSSLLFIPAYALLFWDISERNISHLWATGMLTIPVVIPFVYLALRDELKEEQTKLI